MRTLLLAVLMAAAAFGCAKRIQVATPTPPSDLSARLRAAEAITFPSNRDSALAAVARDAAKSGNIPVLKKALGGMVFINTKDAAAAQCADILIEGKQLAAATEVANTITFINNRDAVLQKIAMAGK